ncbi:MAG: hypothetical protein HKN22_08660 [Bacteroidia bacterium]|nr:hypothetical protein [Bacteroidia bacterium]
MKKLLITILMISPAFAFAQDAEKPAKTKMMYSVHEDQVKPSMYMEYEKICKELVSLMKEHNIEDGGWLTTSTDDYRYWYLSPKSSMADLDKNVFKTLTEKIGKDKMNDLWARMDKCYDKHGSFMITMDTELTYMPSGIDQNPEGETWREFHFWHFTPENEEAAWKVAKEITTLVASVKSPLNYRVYRSGFGTVGTYYLVAFAAKDEADFAAKFAKHRELGGQNLLTKLNELRALTDKYEEVEGQVRNDLSYKPQTKVSATRK